MIVAEGVLIFLAPTLWALLGAFEATAGRIVRAHKAEERLIRNTLVLSTNACMPRISLAVLYVVYAEMPRLHNRKCYFSCPCSGLCADASKPPRDTALWNVFFFAGSGASKSSYFVWYMSACNICTFFSHSVLRLTSFYSRTIACRTSKGAVDTFRCMSRSRPSSVAVL